MEVTLYLPYYDYNDGVFDVSNDYYNEDDYIKAVSDEYNRNKDIVYNSVVGAKNGVSSIVQGGDGQIYKLGSYEPQKEDKIAYSSCDGILYDGNGNDDTVDGIITHFARQESFIEMIEFNRDTSEEEFETEMSLWMREHGSINQYKDFKGEEWVWMNEPKRNVKVHFFNNANEDIYAIFENCRIMDIIDSNSIIVFIEKIRLIDNL